FAFQPTCLLLAVPLLVALAAARRWPELGHAAAGLAPALVALLLWRDGAPSASRPVTPPDDPLLRSMVPPSLHRTVALTWSRLHDTLLQVRGFFWTNRVVEFIPLAGAFAVIRRSPAKGIYVAGWCAALVVIPAGSPAVRVDSGTFFRVALPGLPAYV